MQLLKYIQIKASTILQYYIYYMASFYDMSTSLRLELFLLESVQPSLYKNRSHTLNDACCGNRCLIIPLSVACFLLKHNLTSLD